MKLIKKYLYGKPVLLNDSPAQVALTTLGRDSKAGEKIRLDQAVTLQIINGETPHYIFSENPRAFVYNGDLMIRGSELLKYPLLYTHMGWTDTVSSGILPDLYYRIGNNGSLDTTHYTAFSNTDTYTPIEEGYLPYLLNQAFANNGRYGLISEKKRLGQITSAPENRLAPVLTGYVPGADAMAANGNLEGATLALAGQTAVMNTALGFTGPGFVFQSPFIFGTGYDRVKTAEDWKDYALGGTEMLMSVAPWAYKGYTSLRSATSPTYRLNQLLQKAIDEGLDWDSYYGYLTPEFQFTAPTNVYNASSSGYPQRISLPERKHVHLDTFDLTTLLEAVLHGTPLGDSPSIRDLARGQIGQYQVNLPVPLVPGLAKVLSDFNHVYFWPYERPVVDFLVGYRLGDVSAYENEGLGNSMQLPPSTLFNPKLYQGIKTDYGTAIIRRNLDGTLSLLSIYPGVVQGDNVGSITMTGLKYANTRDPRYIDSYKTLYDFYYRLGHALRSDRPIVSATDSLLNPELLKAKQFDFSKVKPESDTSAQGMYDAAVKRKEEYFDSDYFRNRFEKALGRSSLRDYETLKLIIRSPEVTRKTTVTEGFPLSDAGISTYYGKHGSNLYGQLLDAKIVSKEMPREEYLKSLTDLEKTAFLNAETNRPQITLTEGDETSAMRLADEEIDHILRTSDHPLVRLINKYNKPYLDKMKTKDVTIASDEEKAARASLINLKVAKVDFNKAAEYYKKKFHKELSPDEVKRMVYRDIMSGDKKFYRTFGLEYDYPTFLSLLYEFTPDFIDALEHIIGYNDTNNANDIESYA